MTEVDSSVYPSLHYTCVYRESPKQCAGIIHFFYIYLYENILTVDTYYISFRCTKWWFTIYTHYKLITMISPGIICHHTVIEMLLTLFLMLYIISLWLITLISEVYISLSFLPISFVPLLLPLWGPQILLCIYEFVSVLFCLF